MTETSPRNHLPGGIDALREGAVREGKKFLPIFLYLWVLFALFALHRWILLREANVLYGQSFAIVNAFVLAKVLFFGQSLHLGENFRDRPLLYAVLFKSALFAILLVCFDLIEEVIKNALRGETAAGSMTGIGGGTIEGIVAAGVIVFVVLIPFFAFREMTRVVGAAEMRKLFLVRREKLKPVSPASREAGDGPENA